jgi:peptidoglycan/LPS O-acetylase OafA/YrhL
MARGLAKDPGKTVAGYIVSRFFRVYIPFLFWSAVYVLLAEMKSIAVAHTFHLPPWTTLYAGGHMHLWFLPFLMVVTIIGACLVRGLQSRPWARKIVIGLLVACGAGLMMMPEPAWVSTRELAGDMEFWRFAFRAAPTSCLALALALCTAINGRLPRTTPILAAGGAFLLISALLTEGALDASKILRALAGFGCLLVALLPVGMPLIERIGRYGRYSYGVYLSHVVFLRLVVLWIEHHHVAPSLLVDVLSFAFAFTAALGLSVLLGQSKYTRWALGE